MKWRKKSGAVSEESPSNSEMTPINVKELVARYSIDELSTTAEEYFARISDTWYHTVKPFASPEECPDNLGSFGGLIYAGELRKSHRVLDFAAGTCWTSRYLAQMGCDVIASDISRSALAIGKKSLDLSPLIAPHGSIDFLDFDGYTINLDDSSIDRVLCLDAFHHIVNQDDIMREIHRVLTPGGIFAMSEPGPHHSLLPQSQFEMRNYKVVEQDIVVDEIVRLAINAGFVQCEAAVYSSRPHFVAATDFERTLAHEDHLLAETIRRFHSNHRLIRMRKPGDETVDSRSRAHLAVAMQVQIENRDVFVVAQNTGKAVWLPSGDTPGAVNLGIHTITEDGSVDDLDFHRVHFLSSRLQPGETVKYTFELPELPEHIKTIEVDLVSEHVSWFANVGSVPIRLRIGS